MHDRRNLIELENRLNNILHSLKVIVDYSISIRTDKEMKREVALIWQNFISQFFNYIKQKNKETGENLLSGIGFTRLWR